MSGENENPALPELAAMQYLGDGSQMAGPIADRVGKTALFYDFDREPRLGAKILVQLLEMVSQRQRQTGGALVDYLKID